MAFHADAEAKVQEIDANVEYDRFVDQHRLALMFNNIYCGPVVEFCNILIMVCRN